ncbi:MAG: deoxyribose-phosphate aldolase, partial [Dehalococcoidales bacterium]
METVFDKYKKPLDMEFVRKDIVQIQNTVKQNYTVFNLKKLLSYIDLTSLNNDDNMESILDLCSKLNNYSLQFRDTPSVAAICVFPSLVCVVKENLKVKDMKIVSVAGGFPSSQTFLEVKKLEAKMAIEAGASEIDTVMPAGRFRAGDYINIAGELVAIKKSIGDIPVKVILETGLLDTPENIRNASLLAMQAGADFIKTSTGKIT